MFTKSLLKLDLKEQVFLGIMIALKVALDKLSIGDATLQVGLGFVGSVLLGYIFGPIWGAIGGALSDLVASALFGNLGGFFIGFTLTAAAGPFLYGLFFYHRPVKIWRVIAATLLVTVLINALMNTLWISMMTGANYWPQFMVRLPKQLIAPWIQMIVTYLVLQAIEKLPNRLAR